jgi:hypothetical protein
VKKDNVIELEKPEGSSEDPSKEVLRHGRTRILTETLEAEIG